MQREGWKSTPDSLWSFGKFYQLGTDMILCRNSHYLSTHSAQCARVCAFGVCVFVCTLLKAISGSASPSSPAQIKSDQTEIPCGPEEGEEMGGGAPVASGPSEQVLIGAWPM